MEIFFIYLSLSQFLQKKEPGTESLISGPQTYSQPTAEQASGWAGEWFLQLDPWSLPRSTLILTTRKITEPGVLKSN